MFLTLVVPASVPSLRHSSRATGAVGIGDEIEVPLTSVRSRGGRGRGVVDIGRPRLGAVASPQPGVEPVAGRARNRGCR